MAEPGRVAARPGARPETHKLHFCVLCCPRRGHVRDPPRAGLEAETAGRGAARPAVSREEENPASFRCPRAGLGLLAVSEDRSLENRIGARTMADE